ncbi:MAG: CDP-alcohol phosphatidyltransferase family protein, partial [Bacteroidales bacterium]|nr:CDP-alcohol phosphatidyltransferase family protein [Bacteroidales bacterium]
VGADLVTVAGAGADLVSAIGSYALNVDILDASDDIASMSVSQASILLTAGIFDMLDGQLARKTNKMTKFGALFDSVIDRYSEMVMFFGITYYLVSYHYFLSGVFAFIAMIGSIMVSYVRARAEGLGVECKIGLMQRPERVLTIGISAILYGIISHFTGTFKIIFDWLPFPFIENISIFTIPIFIMAVLTNYTAFQRLNHCRKIM